MPENLRFLEGVWEQVSGMGVNLIAVPDRQGAFGIFDVKIAPLEERLEFSPLLPGEPDGKVGNNIDSGQEDRNQQLVGVTYSQQINHAKDKKNTLHVETGHLLAEQALGDNSAAITNSDWQQHFDLDSGDPLFLALDQGSVTNVHRQASIPHGNALAARGCMHNVNANDLATILERAKTRYRMNPIQHTGGEDELKREGYTSRYFEVLDKVNEDGLIGFKEEHLKEPIGFVMAKLQQMVAKSKRMIHWHVVARNELDPSSKVEPQPGGSLSFLRQDQKKVKSGILNMPFVHHMADVPIVEAEFIWFSDSRGEEFLFYAQKVFLDFSGVFWPHISINFLQKRV